MRELHGTTETDDYAWMLAASGTRDKGRPDLLAYLTAERAYYDAQTRHLAGLAEDLYHEAAGRVPGGVEDSAHWPLRGFEYWTRTPAGSENSQRLRARQGQPGETLLLDENALAEQTGFVDVGVCEPSPDGRLLAWSADTTGAEIYELRFTDLETGRQLPEVIGRSYPGSAWSADSRHLFYLVPDEMNRPHQVWRHHLGTDTSADVMVAEETDARFELTLCASRSGGLVIITSASRDTTEVALVPAADPEQPARTVTPRRPGIEYRVDHASGPDGGELFLVTNDGAVEFRLMRAPAPAPGRASWTEVACPAVAPARDDTRLLTCAVFRDRLLLTVRRSGEPLLVIAGHDGSGVIEAASTMTAGAIRVAHAEDYDAGAVVTAEESLVEPATWCELSLATGERRVVKRREVPGYNRARFLTERVTATAADGTGIPVTIARAACTPLDGSAPCLLYGYGAYEACSDPEFDVSLPSLLDRGVVYAIAHVRGGGEMGRRWWLEGRLAAKPNTFGDFIAVADWLAGEPPGARQPAGDPPGALPATRDARVPAPLVDGSRIVSRGLSAGGLLQGAVYSRAPGRWRAVVAEVPFVDCVNTMLDPGIPLTVNEWDEWGDPRDAGAFACIRCYAPYENPPPGARPDLLVTGALNDPRVLVHEPAKWVARLRETDTAGSRILFRPELGAGAHTGPSGRFGHLGYEAEVHAFILDVLGAGQVIVG